MIILKQIHSHQNSNYPNPNFTLFLTAEERSRSHLRIELKDHIFCLQLPRGTILQVGDILLTEDKSLSVKIEARKEKVITVTAQSTLELLKASYHLGNRHIPLEITTNYLRLNYDHVLERMLLHMGLIVNIENQPFFPEIGAYHHHHG